MKQPINDWWHNSIKTFGRRVGMNACSQALLLFDLDAWIPFFFQLLYADNYHVSNYILKSDYRLRHGQTQILINTIKANKKLFFVLRGRDLHELDLQFKFKQTILPKVKKGVH